MIPRRRFLQSLAVGASGAVRPIVARAGLSTSPIRACILIFYYGGPSHLDLWDMKPSAPAEIRGPLKPISTRVPGLPISELLPESARVADRLAIVRGLHHPMTNHNAAAFAALSGRNPAKGDLELLADDRNDPPCLGSLLSRQLPAIPGLPTFAALPHVMYNLVRLPGQSAGFLGARHEPFQFDSDPSRGDFRVEGLELPENVPPSRLEGRRRLLDRVDDESSEGELRRRREQALDLVYSPRLRRAIALQREDPRIRARYGENKHGQSLLLARRLVEAGVRYVAVYDHQVNGQLVNWDAHSDIYPRLRNDLVPPADRAFAALVEDLEARGLLDSTLVVALGEFGRTPKINASAGRDHWPYCFNAVLAGGGIRGGSVHGASDKVGVYPDRDPTTPADLAATVLHRFGLDPESELTDLSDRPYRLAEGRPRVDWFA